MSDLPADLPEEIVERVQHMLPRDLLHDLRTPLGHILGYSELLIEQMKEAGTGSVFRRPYSPFRFLLTRTRWPTAHSTG